MAGTEEQRRALEAEQLSRKQAEQEERREQERERREQERIRKRLKEIGGDRLDASKEFVAALELLAALTLASREKMARPNPRDFYQKNSIWSLSAGEMPYQGEKLVLSKVRDLATLELYVLYGLEIGYNTHRWTMIDWHEFLTAEDVRSFAAEGDDYDEDTFYTSVMYHFECAEIGWDRITFCSFYALGLVFEKGLLGQSRSRARATHYYRLVEKHLLLVDDGMSPELREQLLEKFASWDHPEADGDPLPETPAIAVEDPRKRTKKTKSRQKSAPAATGEENEVTPKTAESDVGAITAPPAAESAPEARPSDLQEGASVRTGLVDRDAASPAGRETVIAAAASPELIRSEGQQAAEKLAKLKLDQTGDGFVYAFRKRWPVLVIGFPLGYWLYAEDHEVLGVLVVPFLMLLVFATASSQYQKLNPIPGEKELQEKIDRYRKETLR